MNDIPNANSSSVFSSDLQAGVCESLVVDSVVPRSPPIEKRRILETEEAASELLSRFHLLEDRLQDLARQLGRVYELVAAKVVVKELYTTAEVAHLLNRRPYTVREWCRHGRIHAVKTHAGRGEEEEWRIGHEELTRIQNEGLLPLPKN